MKNKIHLPSLRGKMGDWYYYSTIMSFKDIANRVSMVNDIHTDKSLKKLIQREISNRTVSIVEYLKTQEQRFFNAIIVGIYDGNPSWRSLDIDNAMVQDLDEESLENLNRTFGILSLNGDENIFAIDGQHRVKAITDCMNDISASEHLGFDEVTVIFVAHKNTQEGLTRTRRLFSTLNRYAKLVNKNEIIALDEEDNCAILTRNLVEDFELFKDKRIAFNKNRSLSPNNNTAFTNVLVLYDIVKTLLTDKKVLGSIPTKGFNERGFIMKRESDEVLIKMQKDIEKILNEIVLNIPILKNVLIDSNFVDRNNLLFRPIGQNIFFDVLKVAIEQNKKEEALAYFATNSYNLSHKTWKNIFWDEEQNTIKTDKPLQRIAIILILEKLEIEVTRKSTKDKEIISNLNITSNDI